MSNPSQALHLTPILDLNGEEGNTVSTFKPHLLLLDDDPVYGACLKQHAKRMRIPLTYILPNVEVELLPIGDNYDLVLIDYELGMYKGTQLASLFTAAPVVIISSTDQTKNIKMLTGGFSGFLHKETGPTALLQAAVSIGNRW